jgi:inosose dehydratase
MYGTDRGVTVAYHPHVGTTVETAAEIDQLLDKTERLQLCLDFSHVALVGEDPVQQWRRYRERTAYVHLKDWARGSFTELGRGTLGLYVPAILEALLSAGFPGWVVVEQSRSEVAPEESLAVNSAYLQQIG